MSPTSDGGLLVAVVADGVGSTSHAEVAAQLAVSEAVRETLRILEKGDEIEWRRVFDSVADLLSERTADLARRGERPPQTTLTVLVTSTNPAPGEEVWCASVGDSPVLLLRPDREESWDMLLGARSSPAGTPSNVVAALPSKIEELSWTTHPWAEDEVIVMASDGFANGLGGRSDLSRDLACEWRRPPELLRFICDVDFRRATFDDDRTVLALWQGAYDGTVE